MKRLSHLACAAALAAAPAAAAPRVVADIAPIHSLAAQVMGDLGAPSLLVRPGASPHGYAMKPSEAETLAEAEVVFWVGETLTPWLDDALDTLGEDAVAVDLSAAPGVAAAPGGAAPELGPEGDDDHHGHKHGDYAEAEGYDHSRHHGDGGDEADGHGHGHGRGDEHAAAHGDDHDEDRGRGDAHAHDHGDEDPHIWLDPRNAQAAASAMAEALAEADPENASAYRANAAALRERLDALEADLEAAVAPIRGRPFAVLHDAYRHFEARFGVRAAGAVALSDAARPGPRRMEAVREAIRKAGVVCLFAEPQYPRRLAEAAIEGTDVRIGELDPLGAAVPLGPELYEATMRGIAASLNECLAAEG